MRGSVTLIAAADKGRGIGLRGGLLYRIPADLARFRELTMGAALLMGSRTYASLPGPLPGRRIIILTRQPDLRIPGVQTAATIHRALNLASDADCPIYVAGGEQIYRQMMPHAHRIELTEIDDQRPADAFFPAIPSSFREIRREPHLAAGRDPAFDFVTFSRELRAT